jgi:hypothetical protein
MLRVLLLCLLTISLVSCAKNPDGSYTVGVKGSKMWHQTAPAATVNAAYDRKQTYELCLMWDQVYKQNSRDRFFRRQIAKHLKRRGENPLKCANPSSDESKRLRDETRQIRREAEEMRRQAEQNRREAEYQREQARQLCDEAHQQYNECLNNNSFSCLVPNC